MRGLNKVTLIGHLGKDPELQEVSKTGGLGLTVAKLSLATSKSYLSFRQNGNTRNRLENLYALSRFWEYTRNLVAGIQMLVATLRKTE